ncbi:lipocalin family protein [Asticcacaulis tiandongensis]|uniref:lipocalin family protein n=1 Tax=Asticcacaulis tiandongensis TaxID=2565365 RepID=UPI001128AB2F|nr:lipocalin family protein [Asticcacaulis tiandongensis]
MRKALVPLVLLGGTALLLSACMHMPVGNPTVPQPSKPVDLKAYAGLWYEIGRYENRFEKGCEAVTAQYSLRDDGLVQVVNSCRQGATDGPVKVSQGKAKIVENSQNAKLKVSFFGPFFVGDYWVLDRADDYSWSIVGEPRGKYLWILTRDPNPSESTRQGLMTRVKALGYDTALIRPTQH